MSGRRRTRGRANCEFAAASQREDEKEEAPFAEDAQRTGCRRRGEEARPLRAGASAKPAETENHERSRMASAIVPVLRDAGPRRTCRRPTQRADRRADVAARRNSTSITLKDAKVTSRRPTPKRWRPRGDESDQCAAGWAVPGRHSALAISDAPAETDIRLDDYHLPRANEKIIARCASATSFDFRRPGRADERKIKPAERGNYRGRCGRLCSFTRHSQDGSPSSPPPTSRASSATRRGRDDVSAAPATSSTRANLASRRRAISSIDYSLSARSVPQPR